MTTNTGGVVHASGHARVQVGDVHVYNEPNADRCIADLRSTDPRHDKIRIEQTKGGILGNAYKWVLDNAEFQRWRDDEQSRLLWIKGDPGKSKTMLLCGIINELDNSIGDTGILSFFFCQAADSRINSATAVLRGLIFLLVQQEPSLAAHVRKRYDYAREQLFHDAKSNAWLTHRYTTTTPRRFLAVPITKPPVNWYNISRLITVIKSLLLVLQRRVGLAVLYPLLLTQPSTSDWCWLTQ
jgi:hypothetical protein